MKIFHSKTSHGISNRFSGQFNSYRRIFASLFILMPGVMGPVMHGGYPASAQNASSSIVVDDFQGYTSGIFSKWMIRDATRKAAESVYRLVAEEGNIYLAADTRGSSIQIAKKVNWRLGSHPFISWKWRARRLPSNANEAYGNSNDSAASIYVIFQRARVPFMPWDRQPINVIKYVWSTTLPAGRVVNKKKEKLGVVIYEGRFLVLQTGSSKLGRWVIEKRNVLDDYRRLFGANPPGNPLIIAILSDSNETRSSAAADYDDILIMSR